MDFRGGHQQDRNSGRIYGRLVARQAALKISQTTSAPGVETLQRWSRPAAVFSLFYVLFAIGVHGWRVGFLPRFSQTEILSDVLWVFSVGLLAGAFALSMVLLVPFMFVSVFSISEREYSHENQSHDSGQERHRLAFTRGQLHLIGFLLFGAVPLYTIATSVYVDLDVREKFLEMILPIYFLMLIATLYDKKRSGDVNALGLPLSSLFPNFGADRWLQLSEWYRWLRRLSGELLRAFFFALILGMLSFSSAQFLGKIGGAFLAAIGAFWPSVGVLVIVFITIANSANLVWMYSQDKGWLPSAQLISTIVVFMIMVLAVPLVIYFARIGNLSNATAVFDSKFSSVVGRLSKVVQAGDTVATAKVDVVLAFGADVVLAAPGSFQANSTCEFSWFQQIDTSSVDNRTADDRVKCIVLPRSAVFSIL